MSGAVSVTTVYVGNYYEKEGSTVRKYYYADGARVAMRQGSTLYYILTDHLGSTAITTNSGGTAKVGELRYFPHGKTRYTDGTTPTDRRFTGQIEDATIGLYFYNARYYDPYLGRFVQADSIVPEPGNPQDLNRYSYVAGNPLKYTDPTGHMFKPPKRFLIPIDISGWNPKVVQALDVVQEAAHTVAKIPPIIAGPVAAARSFVKYVEVDSKAGTRVIGNRDPVSANELALELVGLSAVIAAPSAGLGEAVDDALFARSSFRRSTIEEAVDAAPRNSSGEMICPTCGEVIPEAIEMQTKNGPVTRRGFDLDHYPTTWTERVEQLKQLPRRPTRQEVLDVYNADVRIQCPTCNQGHGFEGVAGEFE